MVQVNYKFRILADYYFLKKLKEQSDSLQRRIILRLTHIKSSSQHFKKKHNIILPHISKKCVDEDIYDDDTVGKSFHRIRDYENKTLNENLNDEEKNILTAIFLTQLVINEINPHCYILTSDSTMVKKYEMNPHMNGIKRVQILGFNEAIEKIDAYYQKFELQRQIERL